MDWYLIVKFLHVTSSIIWLGGGMVMLVLGVRADRTRDDADMVAIVLKLAYLGPRFFVPSGLLTLVFGAASVWLGQSWNQLWIILGLIGFALTFGAGVSILKPRAERVEADYKTGGASASVIRQSRDILRVAKFDTVLLFTIVADMVIKPTSDEYPVLAVMALLILAAGVVFLGGLKKPAARTA